MKTRKDGCGLTKGAPENRNGKLMALVAIFLLVSYALTWLSLPAALSNDDALYCAHDTLGERMEGVFGSWRHWNGRWGELAGHALGSWAPGVYQWIHPWIVLVLCLCLYRAALGEWPHRGRFRPGVLAWVMILTSGMVLNCHNWFAATCNWLWPSAALLALCILSERALQGGAAAPSRRRLAGSAFLAFLCGMGNEYTFVAGGLWLVMLGAASRKRGTMRVDARWFVVVLCLIAGGLMLVPGWLGRLGELARMGSHAEQEELTHLILRCLICLCWYMAKWILLILAAGFVLGWRNLVVWTARGRGMIILMVGCLPFALMTATPLWGMPRSLTTAQISLVCLTALWMARAERRLAAWRIWALMGAAVALSLSTLIPEGLSSWESKKIRVAFERQLALVEPGRDAVVRLQKPSPIAMPTWWPPLPRCLWQPAVGRLPWGISENMKAPYSEAVSRIYRVRSLRVIIEKQSFDHKKP